MVPNKYCFKLSCIALQSVLFPFWSRVATSIFRLLLCPPRPSITNESTMGCSSSTEPVFTPRQPFCLWEMLLRVQPTHCSQVLVFPGSWWYSGFSGLNNLIVTDAALMENSLIILEQGDINKGSKQEADQENAYRSAYISSPEGRAMMLHTKFDKGLV